MAFVCLENQLLSLSSSVADCTPNNLLFPVYPVNISWAIRPGGLVSQVQNTFIFEGEGGTRCFISDGVCFLLHHIRKQSGNKSGCYMGRSEWLGSSLITSCTHLLYRNGFDTRTSPYTVLESIDNFGLYLGLSYLMTCRLSLFVSVSFHQMELSIFAKIKGSYLQKQSILCFSQINFIESVVLKNFYMLDFPGGSVVKKKKNPPANAGDIG